MSPAAQLGRNLIAPSRALAPWLGFAQQALGKGQWSPHPTRVCAPGVEPLLFAFGEQREKRVGDGSLRGLAAERRIFIGPKPRCLAHCLLQVAIG